MTRRFRFRPNHPKLIFILLLFVVVFSRQGEWASAQASTSPGTIDTSSCMANNNDNSVSVVLGSVPTYAGLYLKSQPDQTISPTSLFFQPFSTGQCISLGTFTPKTSTWTQINTILTPAQLSGGGSFIANSPTIGSAPYASALQLLLVPNASTCMPTTTCQTIYRGWSGALQPTIISGATDQIAVYVAKPILTSHLKTVNYYDNQVFLYSKPNIQAVDHDYLGGGENVITAVAIFANGEQFIATKNINMGPDYSGYYWFRSSLYRSDGRAIFALKITGLVILLMIALWFIHYIHKRRLYKLEHGLGIYGLDEQNNHKPGPDNDPTTR